MPSDRWKPIESAPRDGTRIFVFRPDADNVFRMFGLDYRKDNCWWHSRPDEPPRLWMSIDDLRPRQGPS